MENNVRPPPSSSPPAFSFSGRPGTLPLDDFIAKLEATLLLLSLQAGKDQWSEETSFRVAALYLEHEAMWVWRSVAAQYNLSIAASSSLAVLFFPLVPHTGSLMHDLYTSLRRTFSNTPQRRAELQGFSRQAGEDPLRMYCRLASLLSDTNDKAAAVTYVAQLEPELSDKVNKELSDRPEGYNSLKQVFEVAWGIYNR